MDTFCEDFALVAIRAYGARLCPVPGRISRSGFEHGAASKSFNAAYGATLLRLVSATQPRSGRKVRWNSNPAIAGERSGSLAKWP